MKVGEQRLAPRREIAEPVTLVGALNALLKRWRMVVGVPAAAAVLTVLVSLVIPPTYTATTTFVPEARQQGRTTGIAGVATQLGFPFGNDPTQSPQFYASVLRSRELLERVLLARYAPPGANEGTVDSTTLLRILRVKGRTPADSLARGVKRLNRRVSVRVDNQTNIVRVSVDAAGPELAAAVANRLVQYLNEFNTLKRQSRARWRRRFTEERVAAADSELRRAEEAVKTFYERNRGWQEAPELAFEQTRLRRQVDVGQEVYLTLKRDYETARVEEVNDTPVITVVDLAVPPPRRSHPDLALLVPLAVVLGGMVAAFGAFAAEQMSKLRRDEDDEYREFAGLLRHARQRVSRLIRVRR